MTKKFQLVCIGGGNMARALLGGILDHSAATPDINNKKLTLNATDILVIEPNLEQAASLQQLFPGLMVKSVPDEDLQGARLILLATKPQQLQDVCASIATWVSDSLVLSIAAGTTLASLSSWLQGYQRLVRAMPNTPALAQQGMTGLFAESTRVTDDDQLYVSSLLQAVGQVLWVKTEQQIDAITAISGSGPGYVFYLMEGLQAAALKLGFSEDEARLLVNQTFQGSAILASQSSDALSVLRERVTSKGGTTAAGLAVLQQADVLNIMIETGQAAFDRAQVLGKSVS